MAKKKTFYFDWERMKWLTRFCFFFFFAKMVNQNDLVVNRWEILSNCFNRFFLQVCETYIWFSKKVDYLLQKSQNMFWPSIKTFRTILEQRRLHFCNCHYKIWISHAIITWCIFLKWPKRVSDWKNFVSWINLYLEICGCVGIARSVANHTTFTLGYYYSICNCNTRSFTTGRCYWIC